jgi:hypothetical protein
MGLFKLVKYKRIVKILGFELDPGKGVGSRFELPIFGMTTSSRAFHWLELINPHAQSFLQPW